MNLTPEESSRLFAEFMKTTGVEYPSFAEIDRLRGELDSCRANHDYWDKKHDGLKERIRSLERENKAMRILIQNDRGPYDEEGLQNLLTAVLQDSTAETKGEQG